MANGGTLFFDEVDGLSPAAQGKLLRFLQERTFRPLGSERYEKADVKVIAATNRDLDRLVSDKQLRADLYYRLNVLRLHLPPLRERTCDIPLLAQSLVDGCRPGAAARMTLSAAALRLLALHDWPGNVRELSNVMQRAILACDGSTILPAHIGLAETPPEAAGAGGFRSARAATLAAFERRYIEDLLRKHHGNVTHAAREANQDRRAFGRFIKKHQIKRLAI